MIDLLNFDLTNNIRYLIRPQIIIRFNTAILPYKFKVYYLFSFFTCLSVPLHVVFSKVENKLIKNLHSLVHCKASQF